MRTPRPGEARQKPKKLADVDLAAVRRDMAETIERAKAEDPKELQHRVKELERQLGARPATTTVEQRFTEIPVLKDAQIQRLERLAGRLDDQSKYLLERAKAIGLLEVAKEFADEASRIRAALASARQPGGRGRPEPHLHHPAPRTPSAAGNGEQLPAGERRVLVACAQYGAGCTPQQLTVTTGYKRATRDAYLLRLRNKGYVERRDDFVVATDSGRTALGTDFVPLPTGADLRDYWLAHLPEGESKIFGRVIAAYPDAVDNKMLDEITGYKRATRDAYIQRLAARQLVVRGRGQVRASHNLFPVGAT
jgi:hypothetical protein